METKNNNEAKRGCSIPISVFFSMLLATSLCAIALNEYSRSKIRLKKDKIIYERFMDSIKRHDSIMLNLNKNLQMEK